jgi:phosphoglycerate dehydrogenase-like enzyme
VLGFDKFWDDAFAKQHNPARVAAEEALAQADIVTLHTNLSDGRGTSSTPTAAKMKKGCGAH